MTALRPHGAFWPSRAQQLLLVTALGNEDESLVAWGRLRLTLDLDRLEPGSFALLPLVYRTLAASGIDDPLLPRLKGIYRNTWVKNNLLLERTSQTAEALASADINPVFLTGATLAERFYPDLGLRPSPSIELLVDGKRAATACAHLTCAGWDFRSDISEGPNGPRYFSDAHDNLCIVRTSVGFDFVVPGDPDGAHAPLWEAAELHQLRGGTTVLVPAPGDALLAACVLGARRNPTPTIVWIADSAMVIRHAGETIDWERLLDVGISRGQTLRLLNAFAYLSSLPRVNVPQIVLGRLAATPVTLRQRLIYSGAAGSVTALGALPEIVAEHLVDTGDQSPIRTIASFPRSLRRRWGLRSNRQLPLAAGKRAFRLLGSRNGAA